MGGIKTHASAHTTAAPSDRFPLEIKRLIVQYASQPDRARLARVNSAWQDVSEEMVWETVKIIGHWSIRDGESVSRDKELQAWKDRIHAITARPIRQRGIKKIYAGGTLESVDVMIDFLDLCKTTIESIQQIPTLISPRYQSSMARAIDGARLLPNLTAMVLQLGFDWELELYLALRSTPNLVHLSVRATDCDSEIVIIDRPTLRLPKLSRLRLSAARWESGAAMILSGASGLSSLELANDSQDDIMIGDDEGALEIVMGCSSLQELCLREDVAHQMTHELSGRPCMPGLTRLITEISVSNQIREAQLMHQWDPGCLFPHANLQTATVRPYSTATVEFYCGSIPSDHTTGGIAPWLAEMLSDLPSLRTVSVIPYPTETYIAGHSRQGPNFGGDFAFTSFSDRGEELFLVTYSATTAASPLGPHALPFAPASHGRIWPWEIPAGDVGILPIEIGQTVILTSYRGYPLPWILLQQIAPRGIIADPEAAWVGDLPASHQRGGMELSEEAWELLRGWHAEVEASREEE